jgi:rhamnose utilization protein RhaD (predicted bifunctional aldolase and dehydrogenase)
VVRAAAETRRRAFDKPLADVKGAADYLAEEQEPVMARYDEHDKAQRHAQIFAGLLRVSKTSNLSREAMQRNSPTVM